MNDRIPFFVKFGIFCVIVLVLVFVFSPFAIVPAGHRGVVTTFASNNFGSGSGSSGNSTPIQSAKSASSPLKRLQSRLPV